MKRLFLILILLCGAWTLDCAAQHLSFPPRVNPQGAVQASGVSDPNAASLVALWDMEGPNPTNWLDSIGTNSLVPYGAPTAADAIFGSGKSAQFIQSVNQRLQAADAAALDLTNGFTVALAVRVLEFPSDTNRAWLMLKGKESAGDHEYGLALKLGADNTNWFFQVVFGQADVDATQITDCTLRLGETYLVVFGLPANTNTGFIYLLSSGCNATYGITVGDSKVRTSTNVLSFGSDYESVFPAKAIVDRVALYRAALSSADATQLYTAGAPRDTTEAGFGTPEGVVQAPPGRLYLDRTATKLYKKTTGAAKTGWVAVSEGGAPGGASSMLQFNGTAGTFAGTTNLSFDSANKMLVATPGTGGTNSVEFHGSNANSAFGPNGGLHIGGLTAVGGSNLVVEGVITANGNLQTKGIIVSNAPTMTTNQPTSYPSLSYNQDIGIWLPGHDLVNNLPGGTLAWIGNDGHEEANLYNSDPNGLQTDSDFHVKGLIAGLGGSIWWARELSDVGGRRNWKAVTETMNFGDWALQVSPTNGASAIGNSDTTIPVVLVTSTGAVGLGTNVNPTARLEVRHGGASGWRPTTSAATNTAIVADINADLSSASGIGAALMGIATTANDGNGAKLYGVYTKVSSANHDQTSVGSHSEVFGSGGTIAEFVVNTVTKMIVMGSGNVGIGAITPLASLHVTNASAATDPLLVYTPNSPYGAFQVKSNATVPMVIFPGRIVIGTNGILSGAVDLWPSLDVTTIGQLKITDQSGLLNVPLLSAVQNKTQASGSIKTNESNTYFNNTGASGPGTNTLPASYPGLRFTFYVDSSSVSAINVKLPSTDTIRQVGLTGTNIFCSTIGNLVTLFCPLTNKWVVENIQGSWTLQ